MIIRRNIHCLLTMKAPIKARTTRVIKSRKEKVKTTLTTTTVLTKLRRPSLPRIVRRTNLRKMMTECTGCVNTTSLGACTKPKIVASQPKAVTVTIPWVLHPPRVLYAGDPDTRISVYGYVLYLFGAPIARKSKAGKSVTLSSTEAEIYATSEIAKEVIFAKKLLEEMGTQLQFPIIIKCGNVAAIYLANNHCNSQKTKNIDTHQHCVRLEARYR
jgi:hypothetical protein